ncbi:hypothetical protein EXU57_12800 [Segetibacter sp. 3557_3]|uniref:hypothetical protein n=1 Tax=Segetibacter sp. 3557_3 TaxID=2547429 RepID=UPI0010585A6D|nr:hypothetical protein [Segetibacter sp. 3557_3]TDH25579.1 hypothetical protein EXU57_12800 [Segetibacter sp. 3557_3]
MIEKQLINDKTFWIKVDPHPVERANPNIIPTEYFTATWYQQDPETDGGVGMIIEDEDGEVKLFESPVAALSYAGKILQKGA